MSRLDDIKGGIASGMYGAGSVECEDVKWLVAEVERWKKSYEERSEAYGRAVRMVCDLKQERTALQHQVATLKHDAERDNRCLDCAALPESLCATCDNMEGNG